jgi:hypothetical protein
MNNEEMLELIRSDRPDQVIHKVFSFEENKHGFYNVKVNMEGLLPHYNEDGTTTIKNVHTTLPYPLADFQKLSEFEQCEWMFEYV